MHDMHISDAVREEAPALAGLYCEAGLQTPQESTPEAALAAWDRMQAALPGVRVVAARRCDGMVMGAVTLLIVPMVGHGGTPSAMLEDVAVHPVMQREGLGRQLVQHAMAAAQAAGCYKLALSSSDTREAAHAFYEQLGFERQGASFCVNFAEALPAQHMA